MISTTTLEYKDQGTLLKGFLAYDDKTAGKRPAVLVAHDWSGCNEFAQNKAKQLAEMGYIGFALDMFGNGITANTKEEKSQLIAPLIEDRGKLLQRIQSALEQIRVNDRVDNSCIAAIGFCFGGLCVLDLARSGADIRGVVSFHGLLFPPTGMPTAKIKAKVLALHGYEDPMVPPEQVAAFEQEMNAAKVDWQLHVYGNTKHAFSNPLANDQTLGTIYNEIAAKRSWIAMTNFLTEIFS